MKWKKFQRKLEPTSQNREGSPGSFPIVKRLESTGQNRERFPREISDKKVARINRS